MELTVAIHCVYHTKTDRLVFDVGHQCYSHKLLTGRLSGFSRLRQQGGISGFPKPSESIHDAFIAGHASNSVSVALGMARARTMLGESYQVAALIGDGAMTGGLSYEGLNDAGASGEPIVVILNDNGMSIDPNVGGVSRHLCNLRSRPAYFRLKEGYRTFLSRNPAGMAVYRFTHRIKTIVKQALYPCSMFEAMGFTYMGPVDGHDVEQLIQTLSQAQQMHRPVLVHVCTKKGKGYLPAEAQPEQCHGVGAFDPAVGPYHAEKRDFSAVFGESLTALARENPKICAITAAMAEGTGLQHFAAEHPRRFFDVGIAEGHAVAMAAGMAKQGMTPVFAVYDSFLQRGFDMLIHDVALQQLPVVLGIDRAGLVGADGSTHHGCQSVGYLTQIPGMNVLCPASYEELSSMLAAAVQLGQPVAVRYPKGSEEYPFPRWDGADSTILQQGEDVTLVSYGVLCNELLTAAELLEQQGIHSEIIKLHRIAPLNAEPVLHSVKKTGKLLVLEDVFAVGSIGWQLSAAIAQSGLSADKIILKNLGSTFAGQGTVAQLRCELGLDAAAVAQAVREAM